MDRTRKQSSTSYPILIFMVLSSDHITGATSKTLTVTLSKNGGSFGAASGSVSEIANGWYSLAGNATDRETLGELIVHATATACDPFDASYTIVPSDVFEPDFGMTPTYQARIWMTDDNNGATDYYLVRWYKNGIPVTAGITSPTIQVVKPDDNDLIASTAMTAGTNGRLRYSATTTARILDGVLYEIIVTATIDGATRTFTQQVSRDKAA